MDDNTQKQPPLILVFLCGLGLIFGLVIGAGYYLAIDLIADISTPLLGRLLADAVFGVISGMIGTVILGIIISRLKTSNERSYWKQNKNSIIVLSIGLTFVIVFVVIFILSMFWLMGPDIFYLFGRSLAHALGSGIAIRWYILRYVDDYPVSQQKD